MIILFVGIVLYFISIIRKKSYNPYIGFLLPLIIMGFQSGVEGDYMEYMDSFNSGDMGYTVKELEVAWIAINQLFQPLGFHSMVFFISLFQILICAYYVKNYVSSGKQWMGAIIFFFTFACMLIQMKAMRQGVAMECAMLAFILAEKRRYIPSIIFGILSFGFHNSALIILWILIVYIIIINISKANIFKRFFKQLARINNSRNFVYITLLLMLLFCYFKMSIFNTYLIPLALSSEDFSYQGYLESLGDNQLSLWLLVSFFIKGYLFSSLYVYDSSTRIFSLLAIISIFANLTFFGFGNLMRLSNYFTLFTIATIPNVCKMLEEKYIHKGIIYSNLFFFLYMIIELRTTIPWLISADNDGFATYEFIF